MIRLIAYTIFIVRVSKIQYVDRPLFAVVLYVHRPLLTSKNIVVVLFQRRILQKMGRIHAEYR